MVDLLMDWWFELTGPQATAGSYRLLSGPHVLPAGIHSTGWCTFQACQSRGAFEKGQQQRQITAADINVEEGFFVNADGSSSTVLESLTPGSSEVHVQPHELGILILGHGCAPGCQGCQPLSFPATTGSPPSKILVAGCLHNVGGKKITCRHAAQADIQVTENCCCQFSLHQDEFEPDMWQQTTAAPVMSEQPATSLPKQATTSRSTLHGLALSRAVVEPVLLN